MTITAITPADLQESLNDHAAHIRDMTHLTAEAKRSRLARTTLEHKAAMADLRVQENAEAHAKVRSAAVAAFGTPTSGMSAGDAAATQMAVRDAEDRAAKISSPQAAGAALELAAQQNDGAMQKAIGRRAHEMTVGRFVADPDTSAPVDRRAWNGVLQDYVNGQPASVGHAVNTALHSRGCRWGLNPPASSSERAM